VYVANNQNNSISVIDGHYNTKINDNVPVGKEAILTETSISQTQMTVYLNKE
jgi:YVTN family beta-propeller protein